MFDFQAMVERNLTIQQHNAAVALRSYKPDYTAQVWAQMIDARAALNALNNTIFTEGLEGA